MSIRTLALTAVALTAFAGNSVLARVALREGAADPASFTALRLVSGAVVLALFAFGRHRRSRSIEAGSTVRIRSGIGGSWTGAAALVLYAAPFSFAYLELTTATGALILFGFVQVTMIGWAIARGEWPTRFQWLGLLVAVGGLAYLMWPGVSAPPPEAGLLMALAGISWGIYSLLGKRSVDPLAQTSGNFVRSVPMVGLLALWALPGAHLELSGALFAIASGALASGIGYAIWYAALGGLTSTNAAIVQLAVPVLAALGGVVFLAETVSLRLVLASILVLGGVGAAILGRA